MEACVEALRLVSRCRCLRVRLEMSELLFDGEIDASLQVMMDGYS